MTQPKKVKPTPDLETPTGRIRWVMQKLYGNSQTQMAKETGISQASLANVLGGKRKAGLKILTSIGSHPALSLNWLISGEGQPLAAATEPETAKDYYLPISDRLLPGSPDQSIHAGEHYPVARPLYGPERYFCRIRAEHLEKLPPELAIRPGDLILVETDAGQWLGGMKSLRGKICIVRENYDPGGRLVLVQIPMDAEDEIAGLRAMYMDRDQQSDQSSPSVPPKPQRPMRRSDVVAIVIHLVRQL